jgi:hypothetical protein
MWQVNGGVRVRSLYTAAFDGPSSWSRSSGIGTKAVCSTGWR